MSPASSRSTRRRKGKPTTGIELGPDGIALVRADTGGGALPATACLVEPRHGDADRQGFIERLRRAKDANRLPVRSSVVLWQRREGLAADEARLDPALAPIVAAGFEIDEVLSPAEALARAVSIAGIDTTNAAVCAAAVHSRGGVMAIVSDGAVISSRAFTWPLGSPSPQSGSELLDRYVTASQLSPMLKHFIELARAVYGVDATSICLCGTLGELRSLAMVLIDDLDLDVETLDSADRLGPTYPDALAGAAAFQLAAAAAQRSVSGVEPSHGHDEDQDRNAPRRSASRPITTLAAVLLAVLWSSLQVSGSAPATPFPFPSEAILADQLQGERVVEPLQPEATMGRIGALPAPPPVEDAAPSVIGTAAPRRPRSTGGVTAPLPTVDGVIISGDRRLAIIDGIVVAPGDSVAGRVVSAIDRAGVVLREPSGRETRLAIRARKPDPAGTPIKPQP